MKNGEKKVPCDAWSNAVLLEGMKGIVVRTFAELKWKRTLTVMYLDEGEIMRREMHLVPVEGPLGEAAQGSVWMFSGFLRTGDVMDVGDGGILWDSTVRFGLVCEWSDVVWLDGGSEGDAVKALEEASSNSSVGVE